MMQQRRWVSYIYRYRQNEKCEIAGFVKIQRITSRRQDQARIRMGLKMYKGYPCGCTAYLVKEGKAYSFASIQFKARERDTLLHSEELPWEDPLKQGLSFTEYEGVYFRCDDGEELAGIWGENVFSMEEICVEDMIGGTDGVGNEYGREQKGNSKEGNACLDMWRDLDIRNEAVVTESVTDSKNTISDAGRVWKDDITEKDMTEVSRPVSCEEFLRMYPKLPIFPGSQILDGVKIVPQDIGRLTPEIWKLGVNSFLSHGYYKYRYLLFGKVRFLRGESFVIGVPGVYTNKEKYLANMFGFQNFVPVKKARMNTGNFGYWVYELDNITKHEKRNSG